jgi:pimeloyl-ACP methyl ester carboxylesterase
MRTWIKTLLAILVSLLLLLGIGPFLVPVPESGAKMTPAELAEYDSQFIEVNELRVHYKIRGCYAPRLILLHGFGSGVFTWRDVMDPLSAYGMVFAYDRPAFGLTERPMPGEWQGENPYGMPFQVELLAGFMDRMGIEQAILMGNSMGGTVAMNFTLKYPERVQALILVDPAVYTSGGISGLIKPLLETPQMDHLGPLIARRILDSGPELLEMAWHDPANITTEVVANYRQPLLIKNWDRALWELTKAPGGIDLAAHLAELERPGFGMPILVVTGDDDRIVPTSDSIRLSDEIPGAELAIIPAAGHVPQEEQPRIFLTAVIDFLLRHNLQVEGGSPCPEGSP